MLTFQFTRNILKRTPVTSFLFYVDTKPGVVQHKFNGSHIPQSIFVKQKQRLMSSRSPPSKKTCFNMIIGTHNGTFHCDEVCAVWMLKQLPKYKDAKVVRSRSSDILADCDIVVDVGAVFDHSKCRYDHHQKEFTETFNSLDSTKPWTTKLSSAGLIYVFYGEEVIRTLMEKIATDNSLDATSISQEQVRIIYSKVYENLIEEIDAVDNGISQSDDVPRYVVSTTLGKRVGNLNPRWNEESNDDILLKRFEKAMALVGAEFMDRVTYYQLGWLPAHNIVKEAIEKRFEIHSSGEIICFPNVAAPWKDHVMSLEKELNVETSIKYVLYPDVANSKWRVQCVPIRNDSFVNRLSLPEKWRGVRDTELSNLTGIADCVFVHANGFIGGNATYEGVLKMATESLRQAN